MERFSLSDILDLKEVQSLMDSFHIFSSLGLVLVDHSYRVLLKAGSQAVCQTYHLATDTTRRLCHESHLNLMEKLAKGGEGIETLCINGMNTVAFPLHIGGRQYGAFLIVNFFFEDRPPDLEAFREQAIRQGFPEEEYLLAISRIPLVSRERMVTLANFWRGLSNLLAVSGYEKVLRHKSQTELLASEERFRAIASAARDAVILIDHQGAVSFWNRAAEQIFGYPPDRILGRELHSILAPPEFYERYREGFKKFLVSGQGWAIDRTLELTALRADGSRFPMELSLSGLTIRGEWHAVGIVRDLSTRRKMEHDLLEKETRARSERAKSAFLANMSHEMRTPINGISNFTELAREEVQSDNRSGALKALDVVEKSCDRLLFFVNNLLDLADLDGQGIEFEFQPVSLHQLAHEAVDQFQARLDEKGIKTSFPRPRFETTVIGDHKRLFQVFFHLVYNAVRHCIPDSTLRFRFQRKKSEILFSIEDSGPGIPNHELELIFDKFTQSSRTDTGAGGTGLGLSICREIIRGHGGRIWAENNHEGGSTFFVAFSLDGQVATLLDGETRSARPTG